MERPIITVPRALVRDMQMTWRPEWRGQEAGVSIGGNPLGVVNAFPRWIGDVRFPLHQAQIRRWRAVQAQGQGRLGIYRMWINDPVAFSWTTAAGSRARTGLPFGNGQYTATSQGVAFTPMALTVGAVQAGATEFRIDVSPCGIAPVEGQIMSHDDWPFTVTWVQPVSGTIYDIGVQMLRPAIADGGIIHMQAFGRFELRDERQGDPSYDASHHSVVSVSFQEVLRR